MEHGLQQNVSVTRAPELGKLKSATERVSLVTGKLDAFLFRFSGPRGGSVGESAAPCPPDSYRNDIESLFNAIAYLEDRIAGLDEIG